MLTVDEMHRYDQQMRLDEIGIGGQIKLKNARVFCIGAGGLGSSLLLYLAGAGIGTIGIVDSDVVELSNLHRQVIFEHKSIGAKKALVAQQKLLALNPSIQVNAYCHRLDINNAHGLIRQYDIIADCSDNFATRYLVNDVCQELDKPYVYASASQFKGQLSVFTGKQGPCFRCVFPEVSDRCALPDCREGGVLGVLPGMLGIMQANEIISCITQNKSSQPNTLMTINLQNMQFQHYQLKVNPACLHQPP